MSENILNGLFLVLLIVFPVLLIWFFGKIKDSAKWALIGFWISIGILGVEILALIFVASCFVELIRSLPRLLKEIPVFIGMVVALVVCFMVFCSSMPGFPSR